MLANNNLKVCRTLVMRDFKRHRGKNALLILAAAAVAALYTFVFLLGSSVEAAYLLNYRYASGFTDHIRYTGLTDRQADAVEGDFRVKRAVRTTVLGVVTDPAIGGRTVKLTVSNLPFAESELSVPTTGKLPEKKGEIALDEFTLDSLGIAHEIGASAVLLWTDGAGKEHTTAFTLCGFWAGPANFTEASAFISADTAEELAADGGSVTLGVILYQPKDAKRQAQAILEDCGIPLGSFSTNLVCNDARRELAKEQALPFYRSVLPVLLCGYLMIYCIVQVTARRDAGYYAGLKSLGMTPRQLSWLFAGNGLAVSLSGIWPGFALGFGIHWAVTGRVIYGMDENPALYFLSWPPFALAAVCTVATALLAYTLPQVRLLRMTPVQAKGLAMGRYARHRYGRGRMTLVRLALRAPGRSGFRTVLSGAALLLAVVQLCFVWAKYVSFREELYLEINSPWDYSIIDGSAHLYAQQYNEKNTGITEETVRSLRKRPEVLSVSGLKSHETAMYAPAELRRRIRDFYDQPYDETMTLKETQAAYPEWGDGLDRLVETGEYIGIVVGLEGEYLQYLLDNCPFTDGSFDEETFFSGGCVLAAGAYREGISTPAAGETVEIEGRSCTVTGAVMWDDSFINGSNSTEAAFSIVYIVPLEQFDTYFPGQAYRQLAVNIDTGQQEAFEAYLDQYERGLNRGVGISRRSECVENFVLGRLTAVLPDLVVALVMLGIALIHFVNMLAVGTIGRRAEFAVYESLGMTRGQLCQLVLLEGIFYAAFISAVLVPAVLFFSAAALPGAVAAMGSWCAVYRFTVLPLWLLLPIIFLAAVTTPWVCLCSVTAGSVNERMRSEK